jgi:acyl-CoA thioesterase-2
MSAGPSKREEIQAPLAVLLDRLDLSSLERDRFLGDPEPGGDGPLFGGFVAAQAVMAAGRTVAAGFLHSLHAYFLRPGRHDLPIRYEVDRIRDGRSFTTRRVVAQQGGEAIFNLAASFVRPEPGIAHQSPMPEAPAPETMPDWEDERARILGDPARRRPDGPVEVRICDPDDPNPGVRLPPRRRVWMRPRGTLPDDPRVHAAVLVYATDRTLLGTAARPHGLPWGHRIGASLDHAVWLHHAPRFDGWVLFASESPVAHEARGLILGALYDRAGRRIATVAQEGLIRVPRGADPGRTAS